MLNNFNLFIRLLVLQGVCWTIIATSSCDHEKVVFCYLSGWSIYRRSEGKFDLSHFDPNLCTHLTYMFLGMNETTYKVMSLDNWTDFEYKNVGLIKKLTDKKKHNEHLKVLASIGGWEQGSVRFSAMVSQASRRRTFILSVKQFLRDHKLDGIDFAWQVPVGRGGKPEDRQRFVTLLQELSEELKPDKKLVTALILGGLSTPELDKYYDIKHMAAHVNYIVMDCSRFNSFAEKKTGISSPLYSSDGRNIADVIDFLLGKGVPAGKLVLQLPTFGMSYLMDEEPTRGNYMDVPASDTFKGPWTNEKGLFSYYEMCWELTKGKEPDRWIKRWDNFSLTHYAVNGRKLISYEDPESIDEKVKFIKRKCLGGGSVSPIDTDDFKGICGESFPLLKLARRKLAGIIKTIVETVDF